MLIVMNKTNFKKAIILFWFIWWLIALWTDVVGVMAHAGYLKQSWALDTNYPFLVDSLKMYQVADWIPQLAMVGIILWSLFSTLLFLWASLNLNQSESRWKGLADYAFIISLCYWMAFLLADQLVMKYDLEENHMVQAGFQLLSYLTLYWLPSNED